MRPTGPLDDAKSPPSRAVVHNNMARELERLHKETLTMQAALSPELALQGPRDKALLSLQALDAHAQILLDLSRIVRILGKTSPTGKIDEKTLRDAKILTSTATAIFGPGQKGEDLNPTSGDVTLF